MTEVNCTHIHTVTHSTYNKMPRQFLLLSKPVYTHGRARIDVKKTRHKENQKDDGVETFKKNNSKQESRIQTLFMLKFDYFKSTRM